MTARTDTVYVRADSLRRGTVLADGGRKVTGDWFMYRRGDGYGSVGIDGCRVKFFCAEAVEVHRTYDATGPVCGCCGNRTIPPFPGSGEEGFYCETCGTAYDDPTPPGRCMIADLHDR